jgi:hypothetical protein
VAMVPEVTNAPPLRRDSTLDERTMPPTFSIYIEFLHGST